MLLDLIRIALILALVFVLLALIVSGLVMVDSWNGDCTSLALTKGTYGALGGLGDPNTPAGQAEIARYQQLCNSYRNAGQ